MKVLFIASEVAPFAKTGGLADVTGSLPKELKRLGHDVRIILPFYREVAQGPFDIRKGVASISVQLGSSVQQCSVHQGSLDGIIVYFLEHDPFFDRDYLYGTPTGDYPDNAERFALFCRGVLQFLQDGDFCPDLLHCHDWQTALVPILLKHERARDSFFRDTAVLFTIHNLAYHGLFPKAALEDMGLDKSYFSIDRLEYYGSINLLKGAILTADLLNTVSETYCSEIQTPEFGCGLDGVLRVRVEDLSGIINGIDYVEWNPANDQELSRTFSADNLAGKEADKADLQRLLGLQQEPATPLLGIVSRLSAQKGLDLVARLLPRLAAEGIQLAILGSGEEKFVRLLTKGAESGTHTVSFNFGFDAALAHKIYAGCDMFLMPSHYEPCGLGQLIALRYGTVPIVRKTGGLADTVVDPQESAAATGFSFTPYSAPALWQSIMRAVTAWQDKEEWKEMVRRGMRVDFSWRNSAVQYELLYQKAVNKKRG